MNISEWKDEEVENIHIALLETLNLHFQDQLISFKQKADCSEYCTYLEWILNISTSVSNGCFYINLF